MRTIDAVIVFERAIALLRRAGRHGEAAALLRRLVALQPKRRSAFQLEIADALAAEGQTGEAVEELEALSRDLVRERLSRELVEAREALLRIDPSVRRAVDYGRACVAARDPARALGALQRAYREAPESTDVLELLSWAFLASGAAEKAAAIRTDLGRRYRHALREGAPGADTLESRDEARERINTALRFAESQRSAALAIAEELAERNPLAPDARRTLATVRAVFEDFDGAAYEFLAAVELARAAGNGRLADEILREALGLTRQHPLLRAAIPPPSKWD